MTAPPAAHILGRLATQVATTDDSRVAVQRVVDALRLALKTQLVVFTIAERPDVWRSTGETGAPSGPVTRRAVSWTVAQGAVLRSCEGTLAWDGPQKKLASNLGEGLFGLLRMAARLFVSQYDGPFETRRADTSTEAMARHHDKQLFVHVAAHALRSPIMSLRMQIEGLGRAITKPQRPGQPDRLTQRMQRAIGQCDALVGLSDNLLDVYTLQDQPLELCFGHVDLRAVIRKVVGHLQAQATHAGCTLIVDAPNPVTGCWDTAYLERAVANLVDNAIRYAPGAPVVLRARSLAHGAHLSVEDSGPGIAEAHTERLFERFERGQSMLNSSGWGLGLYLTRHIVEAHGGRVTLARNIAEGCIMQVDLPRQAHVRPTHAIRPAVNAGLHAHL